MDIRYTTASIKTAENLKTIAQSQLLRDLSQLSLPEIEAATDLISQVIPAGNVPGIILTGLPPCRYSNLARKKEWFGDKTFAVTYDGKQTGLCDKAQASCEFTILP